MERFYQDSVEALDEKFNCIFFIPISLADFKQINSTQPSISHFGVFSYHMVACKD